MSLTRRELIQAGAAVALSPSVIGVRAKMPTRALGKTGWKASIYALGSAEIPASEEAVRAIEKLIEGGVNYLDTAPSYQGTRSERVLGEVLRKHRAKVFLATKTLARDADGAYAEIKQSLQRLQTKQIDLLQIHSINVQQELDRVLGKGGAIEGLEKAKKEGLIRFIGITGHTRPEVLLDALNRYPFDSILVPISPLDKHVSDFATEVIPKANKLGISIAGMKALKGIERAKGDDFDPGKFLRYAWSLPISTLTIGLRRESEVAGNLASALAFKKMTLGEMREIEASVSSLATVENLWWKRR
ncbi:MAG: aldo/keto reductase [Fimbriimonadaceae bacterium]